MATQPDGISRLIEAFRMGLSMKQQRESLRLREEDAARDVEKMGLEREIAELSTKLKLNELYSKRSRGGAAAMPIGSNEAGMLIPGAPVQSNIPQEIQLGALPRLGLQQPTSLPVASADELMEMAVREAGATAKAKATGTREGERLDIGSLLQQIIGTRSAESGIEGAAPTSAAPDELRALITALGQFPERTGITQDIPGIAKKGEKLATPELNARTRSMEERGAAHRSAASILAAKDRRTVLTPKQVLDEERALANDFKAFSKGARTLDNNFNVMQTTLDQIDKGQIQDLSAAQQSIVTSFNKMTDEDSVVRESEFARSIEGLALKRRIQGGFQSITRGAKLPPDALRDLVNQAKLYRDQSMKSITKEVDRISTVADDFGLSKKRILGDEPLGGGPKVGTRKTFPNGNVGEWDGTGWRQVKGK